MAARNDLRARRERLLRSLPPLSEIARGSFVVRRLRCGKAHRCRCGRGQLHRAAYLSVTLKGGATEQIFVPRSLEPLVRTWVRNYARWWDAVERISAINRQLLRRRWVGRDR